MYINGCGRRRVPRGGPQICSAGRAGMCCGIYAWGSWVPLASFRSTTSGAPLPSLDGRSLSRPGAGAAGSGAALFLRPKQPHQLRDSSWPLPDAAAAAARSVADSFLCAFSGRSGSSL